MCTVQYIPPVCSLYKVDITYNTPDTGRVDGWYYKCSNCGTELDDYYEDSLDHGEKPFDYCPYCGARVVSWDE